jgi:hypothetical protein
MGSSSTFEQEIFLLNTEPWLLTLSFIHYFSCQPSKIVPGRSFHIRFECLTQSKEMWSPSEWVITHKYGLQIDLGILSASLIG